jgi:hypothetical protein
LAALAFLALAGCDDRPNQWDAYLYNESDDDSITEYSIEGFKTFELCQEAAQRELLRHGKGPVQDYECGYKCGPPAEYGGLNVCEETRK